MTAGKVRTVRGDIDPQSLGVTLAHEHLLLRFHHWRRKAGLPVPESDDARAGGPLRLEDSYWARRSFERHDEHVLDDPQLAIEEAMRFADVGGGTIVDATNPDGGRDARALLAISEATGLHIVMGAGTYLEGHHPLDMESRSIDDLASAIVADITEGADGTDIVAGLIGEIGTSFPITPNEERGLRAAARAQIATGAPLMVHPGRDAEAPFAVADIVEQEGGDLSRTIIAHIDRTLFDQGSMAALAERGCYLEFDLFGQESSYYPYSPIDMPNDATRVDHLISLRERGYGERLLVSHDICRRTCLVRYGGWGYAHILDHVVPVMQRKGMSAAEIYELLVENPRRIFAFAGEAEKSP